MKKQVKDLTQDEIFKICHQMKNKGCCPNCELYQGYMKPCKHQDQSCQNSTIEFDLTNWEDKAGPVKKQIKDLTDEEMNLICKKYHDCTGEGKVTCPLWHGLSCLRGFITKLRYVEKTKVEVEL